MRGRGRPRRFDRQAALRTAMELYWRHGYEGTSLSMLTSAMGITSTSLYAAFGSKEALFREAVELYNAGSEPPNYRALERPDVREAVEGLLREHADAYVRPDTPRGCMVVLAALNLSAGNERIGEFLAECRQDDFTHIRDRISRAISDGQLPDGVDADALAAFVHTVLEGLAIQARDGCTRERAQAVVTGAMLGWDAWTRDAAATAAGKPRGATTTPGPDRPRGTTG